MEPAAVKPSPAHRCNRCNTPTEDAECEECYLVHCAACAEADFVDGMCPDCIDDGEVELPVLLIGEENLRRVTFDEARRVIGAPRGEKISDLDHFRFRLEGGGRVLSGMVYGRALLSADLAPNSRVPGMRGLIGVYKSFVYGWDEHDDELEAYRAIPEALVPAVVAALQKRFG